MKRQALVYFDGDPFMLNFWLKSYDKYWKKEVDSVLLLIGFNALNLDSSILEFDKQILSKYKKVQYTVSDTLLLPESANSVLILSSPADTILLIESDNIVFQEGIVSEYFRSIEEDNIDIMGPDYPLIPNRDTGFRGYGRNFLFSRRDLLMKTDLNFFPKQASEDRNYDCFGWICQQIEDLKPVMGIIPSGQLGPINDFSQPNVGYIHIRQMSSSILGAGSGSYRGWRDEDPKFLEEQKLAFASQHAAWVAKKTVAFRLMMWEALEDKDEIKSFSDKYKTMLDRLMHTAELGEDEVIKYKDYYKGVLNI